MSETWNAFIHLLEISVRKKKKKKKPRQWTQGSASQGMIVTTCGEKNRSKKKQKKKKRKDFHFFFKSLHTSGDVWRSTIKESNLLILDIQTLRSE